jgi:hypothetical protein
MIDVPAFPVRVSRWRRKARRSFSRLQLMERPQRWGGSRVLVGLCWVSLLVSVRADGPVNATDEGAAPSNTCSNPQCTPLEVRKLLKYVPFLPPRYDNQKTS